MTKFRSTLGVISGTSMDGVDVALLQSDGETLGDIGPAATYSLDDAHRALLRRAMAAAKGGAVRGEPIIDEAEAAVTKAHEFALRRFVSDHALRLEDIACVGFHGQTVFHAPERGITLQLGDGQALADSLGVPVAWDFRTADVIAGGEGAPLVPVYHRALAQRLGRGLPIAFVNIGGVANVTYVGEGDTLIALDTGPGNALIDDLISSRRGLAFDADGEITMRGHPDVSRVERWLEHPFFARPVPKSLDRDAFAATDVTGLDDDDAAATLAAFTASALNRGFQLLPQVPDLVVVCGGGRLNRGLMKLLATELAPAEVVAAEHLGLDGDAIEAEAFAYLALRVAEGLPLTFPGTTGAPRPLPGGRWSRPNRNN
ncbi:anhydro-N-acetylmuramic acid kinase [Afifella sp. H1R]|uniref:anhydro-N-acetylmuramic acid kinase n=1 Tax=Afifella sp. H1R TaxID=2908841 RepID=UPI00351D4E73